MFVCSKNKHGEITEISIEPKHTMDELVQNIEELGNIKRVRINKLHYCCQCSRDIEEILLGDIDSDINILNDLASSDIVSPSSEEVVKSSVDTLRSDIINK